MLIVKTQKMKQTEVYMTGSPMTDNTPEPEKKKEDTNELLAKLSKKLEEGDQFSLLDVDIEQGLQYQRMLLAQQLLNLSIQIGLLYSEDNWKEFSQMVTDDKKLSGLVGDMKLYLESQGGPDSNDHVCDDCAGGD